MLKFMTSCLYLCHHGVEEFGLLAGGGVNLLFQRVAQGHQLVDAGDNALLFGKRGVELQIAQAFRCLASASLPDFQIDDGFVEAVGLFEKLGDLQGNQPGAGFQNQGLVKILLVVDAVLYFIAVLVKHAFVRPPAGQVFVYVDAHDFIGNQKSVVDSLPQAVGINGVAKIVDIGDFFGLLGGGGETDLGGGCDVFKDFMPGRIGVSGAPMTFIGEIRGVKAHARQCRPWQCCCGTKSRHRLN